MYELYAKIGEQHLEIEGLKKRFGKLLNVIADIVRGDIDLSRVMVDLTNQGVSWAPIGQRPAMPATINGLPVCVVAPEKQTCQPSSNEAAT